MGKKIVKLTEEKFNKIITTAVEKVLNEVAMLGNFNENIKMTAIWNWSFSPTNRRKKITSASATLSR